MMMGTIDMTKPRKPKPYAPIMATPAMETAQVAHPRLAGLTETVRRVVDTIESMRKRKQIDERQYQAADRIRVAQATIYGVMGSAGDYERSRGGGSHGQPPALTYMLAGETLREAKNFLYPRDYLVVYRVCALGMTIQEAAENLYHPVNRTVLEDCGRRLREGLDQMADRWFPINAGAASKIRSTVMERAGVTDVQHVSQARTAHATSNKIFRSGK